VRSDNSGSENSKWIVFHLICITTDRRRIGSEYSGKLEANRSRLQPTGGEARSLESDNEVYCLVYEFSPVGIIRSCFKEKFGIPRQPGLVPQASATLELQAPFDNDDWSRGLEEFSHLWLIYLFHATKLARRKSTVRPPRLGGNRRVGVFATRAPFRPNPIGLSVVRLLKIERGVPGTLLHLAGVDILDGTPVLDIKPYVPYADALPNACGGYAETSPIVLSVRFDGVAEAAARISGPEGAEDLRPLIIGLLRLDPRPAYHARRAGADVYGMKICDVDVKWQVEKSGASVRVLGVEKVAPATNSGRLVKDFRAMDE
jgi:tRNA-Thr(GGU) m(6)t(6)A37 methyltransferase TsaA